jgi:hypothetical protein
MRFNSIIAAHSEVTFQLDREDSFCSSHRNPHPPGISGAVNDSGLNPGLPKTEPLQENQCVPPGRIYFVLHRREQMLSWMLCWVTSGFAAPGVIAESG